MFSATMPPAVERIAHKYLRRASIVLIGEVSALIHQCLVDYVYESS